MLAMQNWVCLLDFYFNTTPEANCTGRSPRIINAWNKMSSLLQPLAAHAHPLQALRCFLATLIFKVSKYADKAQRQCRRVEFADLETISGRLNLSHKNYLSHMLPFFPSPTLLQSESRQPAENVPGVKATPWR